MLHFKCFKILCIDCFHDVRGVGTRRWEIKWNGYFFPTTLLRNFLKSSSRNDHAIDFVQIKLFGSEDRFFLKYRARYGKDRKYRFKFEIVARLNPSCVIQG